MIKLMIPWLLFPYLIEWLDGSYAKASILVAVLIVILCFDNLRKGFVIECTLVTCLIGMAVVSVYWPALSSFDSVKVLLYGVLTIAGWLGVLFRHPFTLQYSRAGVDENVRQTSEFFEINNAITKAWCMAFSINWVLAGLSFSFEEYWPVFMIGSYMSILIASVITEVFPEAYFNKRNSLHG
ncbi:hypothetical protein [Pseudomonas brassicacearum]|uniref:Intracellular septation protein A n=1 Tax=Pseudomonas brassicacearum TaxID=930166 RepID=A0A423GIQ1_9PSED|nr:hypothetical protein [Pseudomonas brassicacearum]ROM89590.1 hypothetical protein BK658_28055 [Pseudomonas brassicacearum]